MARRQKRRGRKISGILLLDKPVGLTSNAALQEVKRLYKADKAGHTGNLDPLASGLLPVCFGEATKLSAFLLDSDKVYIGVCKLGERTASGDAEAEVFERRPTDGVTSARVEEVLEGFRGAIQQIPPMHSAIKRQGQPLYKLAHQGIEVEREPRSVHIHELRMLRLEGDELEIYVHCSKGTYIRTLAEDIGEALGCGAHLSQLRRTAVGPFTEGGMVTMEALEEKGRQGFDALDDLLLPMEEALSGWPAVALTDTSAFYVRQGQPVLVPQAPTVGWVRLFGPEQEFLGVGHVLDDGRIAPKRLVRAS
ncbi:tRNA pseudouridine(55) synthase TruB [Thiohalomonas denitrificans]|uniref:tRNA pseudouridine synthase B n=1 Tax=Thiohalomonas denitrificans TaxID=415747 RepID=A0A1G5PIR3_9GAMM|nr:tRNA pseudouridine(55) synthase TruB [Thiohalomonas denitrificans]SCZ49405.1 tRNA pseudouridine synthase B [Thiohalomonas denitrificans]